MSRRNEAGYDADYLGDAFFVFALAAVVAFTFGLSGEGCELTDDSNLPELTPEPAP